MTRGARRAAPPPAAGSFAPYTLVRPTESHALEDASSTPGVASAANSDTAGQGETHHAPHVPGPA